MYQIYQVAPNDSLSSIAAKFNTTIDEIRRINGMALNTMLMPGSYIVIPRVENGLYKTYIVEKGDNLYAIAMKNNTNVKNLLLINGLNENDYIYPGQEILVPNDGVNIYVTENDTLRDVASKLGLSEEEIIKQNETIYLLPEQIIIYKKRENL